MTLHAITPTDSRKPARCCECGLSLRVNEPFLGGVAQHVRCPGCGVHLHVRRISATTWQVRTAAESAGQRTRPLPAVAPPAVRAAFFTACRRVGALLSTKSVEPGMSTLQPKEQP